LGHNFALDLYPFRKNFCISGDYSHKNVSAFSSPIKLAVNENSQICSPEAGRLELFFLSARQ
jgi:hypothetical protein